MNQIRQIGIPGHETGIGVLAKSLNGKSPENLRDTGIMMRPMEAPLANNGLLSFDGGAAAHLGRILQTGDIVYIADLLHRHIDEVKDAEVIALEYPAVYIGRTRDGLNFQAIRRIPRQQEINDAINNSRVSPTQGAWSQFPLGSERRVSERLLALFVAKTGFDPVVSADGLAITGAAFSMSRNSSEQSIQYVGCGSHRGGGLAALDTIIPGVLHRESLTLPWNPQRRSIIIRGSMQHGTFSPLDTAGNIDNSFTTQQIQDCTDAIYMATAVRVHWQLNSAGERLIQLGTIVGAQADTVKKLPQMYREQVEFGKVQKEFRQKMGLRR